MTTFVSYLGGSAGDMFTASCNGINLVDTNQFCHTKVVIAPVTACTIKHKEKQIQSGKISLHQAIADIPFEFISTHLFHELGDNKVLNIIVNDTQVFDKMIQRQMWLQRLTVKKDSGNIATHVYNLCLQKRFMDASEFWFAFSKKLAINRMADKIQSQQHQKLDFSKLFTNDFVSSLNEQNFTTNTKILKLNHDFWIQGQPLLSYNDVVESICEKFKTYDWDSNDQI
jgi:hypothetical protein